MNWQAFDAFVVNSLTVSASVRVCCWFHDVLLNFIMLLHPMWTVDLPMQSLFASAIVIPYVCIVDDQ